jgi:hypothetical protein
LTVDFSQVTVEVFADMEEKDTPYQRQGELQCLTMLTTTKSHTLIIEAGPPDFAVE